MINHISIKNFAIIQNTEIDFQDGLNIITGETGSGKSIVIEAISLALGSRADSSLIRNGSDKAIVQLAADIDNEEYVITREVSANGKNLCKLNGSLISLSELNIVCKKIADIHGQYDNQYLLNPDNHITLVDNYHFNEINSLKESYLLSFNNYSETLSSLNKLIKKEQENIKKADFYRYELNEIGNASLTLGEDEALEDRISILQNSEKIFSAIEGTYSAMMNDENSILSALNHCFRQLESIASFSKELETVSSDFGDTYYKLEDLVENLRNMKENIVFSPNELDESISRLDLISKLKKKYGQTIAEILEYEAKIEKELNEIDNFDAIRETLKKDLAKLEKEVRTKADKLTAARKSSATELSSSILKELHDLNFKNSQLEIAFQQASTLTNQGQDIVEILISTNIGEPVKPLVKTASGGEISRIMLAFKNVTCKYDNIPTMIFDEIDSGISGITASIVGEKLKEIASEHQIICITHLPQIAATGSSNYCIKKITDETSTYTIVEKLDYSEKVDEIARLLGGTNITETTKKSAVELIEKSS